MEDEEMIKMNQKYSKIDGESNKTEEEGEFMDLHKSVGHLNFYRSDFDLNLVLKKSSNVFPPFLFSLCFL